MEMRGKKTYVHVMLEIDSHISTCSYGPESRAQLLVMHPDLNVIPIEKLIQTPSMIKMHMSQNAVPSLELLSLSHIVFTHIFFTSSNLWPVASIAAFNSCLGSYLTRVNTSASSGPQTVG